DSTDSSIQTFPPRFSIYSSILFTSVVCCFSHISSFVRLIDSSTHSNAEGEQITARILTVFMFSNTFSLLYILIQKIIEVPYPLFLGYFEWECKSTGIGNECPKSVGDQIQNC